MRKIIYTANIGNYDKNVWLKGKTFDGWDVKVIEEPGTVLDARRHKIMPEFWDDYDLSIWIDANIELKCHPDNLVYYLNSNTDSVDYYDMAFAEHGRDCLYEEAQACIERRKDDAEKIKSQISLYRSKNFPGHAGLVATGIMIRRHHGITKDMMTCWLHEVLNRSKRDQISFPFVYKMFIGGLNYNLIPYKYYENGTFIIHRHR